MIGSSELEKNPPVDRHLLAMLDAAATTEDSSMQNGMMYSFPSMMKLVATPTGRDIVPITFSIIRSAESSANSPVEAQASAWVSSKDANFLTISLRSSTLRRKKPLSRLSSTGMAIPVLFPT